MKLSIYDNYDAIFCTIKKKNLLVLRINCYFHFFAQNLPNCSKCMSNGTRINAVIDGIKNIQERTFDFRIEAAAEFFEGKHSNEPLLLKKIKENYWCEPKWNFMSTRIEAGDPCSNDGSESCIRMLEELETVHHASLAKDFLKQLDGHLQARSMLVDNF